ncbi:unnamed protein product, partial [Oncorhynchus mykiss]
KYLKICLEAWGPPDCYSLISKPKNAQWSSTVCICVCFWLAFSTHYSNSVFVTHLLLSTTSQIGSFFMINLCLVVIATQFSETKQREHQLMQEQRAQCLSSSTLASLHEPGDCYEELFQLVCHMLRKARRRSVALYNQLRGRPLPPPPTRGRGRGGGRGGGEGGGSANGGERHHLRQPRQTPCPHQSKLDPVHSSQPLGNSIALAVPQNTEDCPQCAAALSLREGAGAVGDSANGEEEEGAVEETDREENHLEEKAEEGEGVKKKRKRRSCFGHCKDMWDEMRKKLWGIVESKYFNRGIMIAILINTISMGIEHHNQVNILFSSILSA